MKVEQGPIARKVNNLKHTDIPLHKFF